LKLRESSPVAMFPKHTQNEIGQRASSTSILCRWANLVGLGLIALGFCLESVKADKTHSGITCFALATLLCVVYPVDTLVCALQGQTCAICAIAGSAANLSLMVLAFCRYMAKPSGHRDQAGLGAFAVVAACVVCLCMVPILKNGTGGFTINQFLTGYYLWLAGLILTATTFLKAMLSQADPVPAARSLDDRPGTGEMR
jgi:hypothetical protein